MLHTIFLGAGADIFLVLLYLVAIVGGIILYFTFLSDKNEGKYIGWKGEVYNLLSFRKLCIESVLKLFYTITVCVICIVALIVLFGGFSSSLSFGSSLGGCLAILIFGNLGVRIVYELLLLMVLICKNLFEINKKLGGDTTQIPDFEDIQKLSLPKAKPIHIDLPKFRKKQDKNFCKYCGAEIDEDDALFCTKCGKPR